MHVAMQFQIGCVHLNRNMLYREQFICKSCCNGTDPSGSPSQWVWVGPTRKLESLQARQAGTAPPPHPQKTFKNPTVAADFNLRPLTTTAHCEYFSQTDFNNKNPPKHPPPSRQLGSPICFFLHKVTIRPSYTTLSYPLPPPLPLSPCWFLVP
jgi:hypothetical protein